MSDQIDPNWKEVYGFVRPYENPIMFPSGSDFTEFEIAVVIGGLIFTNRYVVSNANLKEHPSACGYALDHLVEKIDRKIQKLGLANE